MPAIPKTHIPDDNLYAVASWDTSKDGPKKALRIGNNLLRISRRSASDRDCKGAARSSPYSGEDYASRHASHQTTSDRTCFRLCDYRSY